MRHELVDHTLQKARDRHRIGRTEQHCRTRQGTTHHQHGSSASSSSSGSSRSAPSSPKERAASCARSRRGSLRRHGRGIAARVLFDVGQHICRVKRQIENPTLIPHARQRQPNRSLNTIFVRKRSQTSRTHIRLCLNL